MLYFATTMLNFDITNSVVASQYCTVLSHCSIAISQCSIIPSKMLNFDIKGLNMKNHKDPLCHHNATL